MLCGAVVEQRDADGQTAADYDSRSLMYAVWCSC